MSARERGGEEYARMSLWLKLSSSNAAGASIANHSLRGSLKSFSAATR
jgi:hypothetical protein